MLNCCMIECCEPEDKGSIGAFYVRYHAELAGHKVTVADDTSSEYDVEMISVHHCNDFPRLAKAKAKAPLKVISTARNPKSCARSWKPSKANPLKSPPYLNCPACAGRKCWPCGGTALRRSKTGISRVSRM